METVNSPTRIRRPVTTRVSSVLDELRVTLEQALQRGEATTIVKADIKITAGGIGYASIEATDIRRIIG